jgi:hypothetical protein
MPENILVEAKITVDPSPDFSGYSIVKLEVPRMDALRGYGLIGEFGTRRIRIYSESRVELPYGFSDRYCYLLGMSSDINGDQKRMRSEEASRTALAIADAISDLNTRWANGWKPRGFKRWRERV